MKKETKYDYLPSLVEGCVRTYSIVALLALTEIVSQPCSHYKNKLLKLQ